MSWNSRSSGYGGGTPSSGGSYGGGGYSGGGSTARPTPSNSHSGYAAPPARPSSGGSPTTSSSAPQNFQVSGCGNPTVANIIKGPYVLHGTNHGKPFYKKEGPPGTVSVLIYFWDERDGASFSGWWFGPKVGGDQVWAYNGNKPSPTPPLNGWKVPWDGPVDEQLRISASGGSSGGGGGSDRSSGAASRVVPPRSDSQSDYRRREDDSARQRQQQEEERRRRDDAARRERERQQQIEEERKRAVIEQQKREEERRRRAQEEERRRRERQEEEDRRRAEMKKKREEEEIRRREQAAVLIVRKVIQRVRIATPDNYDQLRTELEEAQTAQLEDMGSQAEKVSAEAEKALQQAQQRIDEINESRAAEERRRAEEEKRRKEEEEQCDRLMKEAGEEVEGAEEKVDEATKATEAVTDDKAPDALVEAAEKAEKIIEGALKAIDEVVKAVDAKRKEMGFTDAARKVRDDIDKLNNRLSTGRRTLEKHQHTMKTARDKAARKAGALKKLAEKQAKFSKWDTDGDGKLSQKEVQAFSASYFQFEVPEEVLAKVMKTLEPVVFEKFDRARAMVAIAKSEIEARKQRAEAEEKRKARDLAKAEMQKVVDEAAELLKKAEEASSEVEDKARPLSNRTDSMAADKIKEDAAAALSSTAEVEKTLSDCMEKLNKVEEDCAASDDLKDFDKRDVPRLKQRHGRVISRLEKVTAAAKVANEKAVRKAYAELEQKRTEAVTAMRGFMSTESKSSEQLFEHVGAGKDITTEKFTEFLKGLSSLKLEGEQAGRLFTHIAGEADTIGKEMFFDLLRMYFKCVKATVLTEDITIKSKTVRRLELNEVLEVLEGPTKEEGVNVQRVKVQAVNDDAQGWATIAGNQGTPFLEPGGNLFSCVKETTITDGFSITDSKTVRRLNVGEVVEVLEFGKKDAGIKRVKAKAKEDGASGWITVCGNQGTTFLEPC